MIRTKVQPTTDSRTFWLDINYMGSKENNIRIGLDPSDNDRLWIYEPGKPAVGKDFSGLHMAVGDVVEALIPYRVLTPLLPGAMDITMRFPDHPWIRVTPSAYDPYSKRVDVGPAVASYWLIPDATALDPPPPAPSLIASTLSVPFVGKWYVSQGALTQGSHKGVWAYDLAMVDETGSFSSVADANQNEYQYCWNQPILSPVDGVVTSVTSDVPDHVANTKLVASSTVPSNVVSVARPDGIVVSMIHCRMNTARVLVGDQVSVGQELARVGNSGNSEGPHLHLQCSSEGGTVPFVFRNVTVSINQLKDDPWRRDLPIWQPAEGYFLESTGNAATN